MFSKIKQDEEEFLSIIRGRARKDLKKFLTQGDIILPKKGEGKVISIPVPSIDIPTFRLGSYGGVGQGQGEPGTNLGPIGQEPGENGEKQAGTGTSPDLIEVEIPVHEFLEWLQELLQLPNIEPKGEKALRSQDHKYSEIRKVGPETLLHKKRTFKAALKRSLAEATYNPSEPMIIPMRDDKRYRSWEVISKPKNNAVIIYMMDVSGSMGDDEREVVRYLCALCEFWLSWNYDGLETAYIIHNGEASRVSRDEFFSTRRMGGTVASTAHETCIALMENEFPPSQWNIYPMYFSDGFNWSRDDERCMALLREKIMPFVNQYSYGEVEVYRSWWGDYARSDANTFSRPGNFGDNLSKEFKTESKVAWSAVKDREQVIDALKKFFGQGN
jgi:uncharacterized sporulation protein YeaH/YhbH (DUF444 family)